MAVRVKFKDPNMADKVYPTATKWTWSEATIKIEDGGLLAQYHTSEIFSLEKE